MFEFFVLTALMGRLNDISKDVRQGAMAGLRDVFIHWRAQGASCAMETKFVDLVRVLALDDDLPSKTFADGISFKNTFPFINANMMFVLLKQEFCNQCLSI